PWSCALAPYTALFRSANDVTVPPTTFTPGLQTYRGSCLCGAVRYEADLDLAEGTVRCNCTFCTKTGWWSSYVKPGAFRLLQGRERLISFATKNPMVEETTCGGCGVRAYGHGNRSEEHTSELQSRENLVCRLLLEKKNKTDVVL